MNTVSLFIRDPDWAQAETARLHRHVKGMSIEQILSSPLQDLKDAIAVGMWLGEPSGVRKAIEAGRFDVATLLLESGAPIDHHAAVAAVEADRLDLLETVLAIQGDTNDAWEKAMAVGNSPAMRLILKHHPKVDLETAFQHVDDVDLLREIVDESASAERHEGRKGLMRHVAAQANIAGLQVAAEMGVDMRRIPASWIVELPAGAPVAKRVPFLKAALKLGLSVSKSHNGHYDALASVLKYEDDWMPRDLAERTALLLAAGASAHRCDDRRETPLHRAARVREPEVVHLLMDSGARLMQRDSLGCTPLMQSIQRINAPIFTTMLGLAVEREPLTLLMCDEKGWGLLQYAAVFGKGQDRITVVKAMLDAGMNPDLRDARGMTVREAMQAHPATEGSKQVLALLDSHAAQLAIEQSIQTARPRPN